MTERNKYNNLWADKLQEVSLPDAGEAWMSMEAILDKELPPLASARRRPLTWRLADLRRRWLLVALLLLLLIGVCNCPAGRRWFDAAHTGTPTPAPAPGSTPPVTPSSPVGPTAPAPGSSPAAPEPAAPSSRANKTPGTPSSAPVPSPAVTPATAANTPSGATAFPAAPPSSHTHAKNPPVATVPAPIGHPPHRPVNRNIGSPVGGPANRATGVTGSPTGKPTPDGSMAFNPAGSTTPADSPVHVNQPAANPETGKAKSDSGTAHHTAPVKKDSVHKKKPPPPRADTVETLRGFMAGTGVNQFFPIGGQTASGYNSSGISGTLSDYIPIPMVRYYFNKKLFVQLEAQFNTPQYTKSNLTVANTIPDSGTITVRTVTSVVSLKKLFYFNLPLSLHYNFSDHFAFGAGLQFSRLTNAVGFFDNNVITPGRPDTVSSETKSFKGDSIYQRIRTDEFRFLVDFGYTWKHLLVGMRYNQAMSKFVDIQIKPGQITQGRNSSLQLYMRYILWDGRKKKVTVK